MTYRPTQRPAANDPHHAGLIHSSTRTALSVNADASNWTGQHSTFRVTTLEIRRKHDGITMRFRAQEVDVTRQPRAGRTR